MESRDGTMSPRYQGETYVAPSWSWAALQGGVHIPSIGDMGSQSTSRALDLHWFLFTKEPAPIEESVVLIT